MWECLPSRLEACGELGREYYKSVDLGNDQMTRQGLFAVWTILKDNAFWHIIFCGGNFR